MKGAVRGRGRPRRKVVFHEPSLHTKLVQSNKLVHTGLYSDDDLGWMCSSWGGDRLLAWEQVGLTKNEACVIDHVDFWCWKESEHIRVDHGRQLKNLPHIQESQMHLLLRHVCLVRWRKHLRPF